MSNTPTNDTEVPANKVGASTHEELEAFERYATALRMDEIDTDTYRDRNDHHPDLDPAILDTLDRREFDASYLRAIHAYVLQDVYDWAGDLRKDGETTVAMGIDHAPPNVMRTVLPHLESDIALDRPDFNTPPRQAIETAADHWSQMTYLHPFLDGNSRSQRVFFNEYLRDAGWELNWDKIDAGAVHGARHVGIMFDDPTYLAAQLEPGLAPFGDPAAAGSLGRLARTEYTQGRQQVEDKYIAMLTYADAASDNPSKDGYTYAAQTRAANRASAIASRGSLRSTPSRTSAPDSRQRPSVSTGPTSDRSHGR
ncbi:Fic/DOC family protein [Gordonia sp. (in: high G+C Gram-positive bacteria)]|uniref:Fic/DOC family protein n=1 Tax=Gordonia sp. (in: high G+C Gram-positive bacteria) TaxID=84139 RepID=UPI003C76ED33